MSSGAGGTVIFGREYDRERIIELILAGDSKNLNPILADRGTGRSTILHLIYNDERISGAFDKRRLVCMPEHLDEKRLMRAIVESLAGIPCDITDLHILEEIVNEEVQNNKFLLLLDDFESKNQRCWDLLSMILGIGTIGSAIVVTTTQDSLATVGGPMQFYSMNPLSDYWCWKVFEQCTSYPDDPEGSSTKSVNIGRHLVAKCQNVTMCVVVLGGLLRHLTTQEQWRAVSENSLWEVDGMEGDVFPTLLVCYDHLPINIKQCFKYCSLFPKNYVFRRQDVVRLWLSQGLIEQSEGKELEDVGLEYFDELQSRAFFQPSPLNGIREGNFVMPGMIYDLGQKVSMNEYFQSEGLERPLENARHLAFVSHEFQSVVLNQLTECVQDLQTFLVVSTSVFQDEGIHSPILNVEGLSDLFAKFCNLTTVNLSNTDIEELPVAIRGLSNLRYLALSNTKIKSIPFEISNLVCLQTLEVRNCVFLGELPGTIQELVNLRYLDVTQDAGAIIIPRGIGKLTNLRALPVFNVGIDPEHCVIGELRDLVHLNGCLQISGLVNVTSGMESKEADMKRKGNIEILSLLWSDGEMISNGDEGAEIAEEVLENLHPADKLREIVIRDYPGKYFPTWMGRSLFSQLVSIILDNCYNCETLPYLGALPSLRFLSIQKLHSVQRMELSNSDHVPENSVRYPSLEILNIWEMYELEKWVEIESADYPCLRSLSINKCPFIKNIPRFSSLVELSLYSSSIQFLEVMDLPALHYLKIKGIRNTKSIKLPDNLAELKKLDISHCPELQSIEGLPELKSIEKINVVACPKLELPNNLHYKQERESMMQGIKD